MKDSLDNILRIFCQITNASVAYLLKVEDGSPEIIQYFGEYSADDLLINDLNSDIVNTENPDATKLKYVDSFKKLFNVYNLHSVYINELSEKSSPDLLIYFVGLSRNETLFNKSVKDKIEFVVPLLKDYLSLQLDMLSDGNKFVENINDKYNFLCDSSDDLIFTLDRGGQFTMVNPRGAKGLGYTREELTGNHFLEYVEESNKTAIAESFQKILTSSGITIFEVTLVDKYSNQVVYKISARPVHENGELTGMLGLGHNVSKLDRYRTKFDELNEKHKEVNRILAIERDRAKEQISILEELNTLKNQFISNVSHELRTPLASIVGFSETIASDPELPPEMIDEFVNVILTEGKRLAKLVNDILDFSRLETGIEILEKSDFDIISELNELIEANKINLEEKNISFNLEIPESEIIINADKDRVGKAINHIISNAIKFSHENGRISIIAQEFLKEVEILVSDTGIGIPREELPRLFQKFNKINREGAQTQGAGFGLVTAKQIIDAHKGLIQIKSELNQGTTVIIRLPKNID